MHSGGILPHLLSKHLPLLGSVIFWVTLWVFRERQDRTRWQDLWVSIGVLVWKSTGDLSTLLTSVTSLWDTLPSIVQKAGYAAVALYALSTLQDLLGLADYEELPKGGMPWLLPSRTSHMRMFPEKHSFSHSYLQVAVPVESEGRFGNLISVGNVAKKGWFHVEPSDYLERISKEGNLKSRLAVYLQAQVRLPAIPELEYIADGSTGRRRFTVGPCLSFDCSSLLGLCFQSCFVLVYL